MADNKEWSPTTREEWTELFAEGFGKALSARDEAEAKAKAAADEEAAKKAAEEAASKPGFRDRLLGF